jgi:hypothetical protein
MLVQQLELHFNGSAEMLASAEKKKTHFLHTQTLIETLDI